MTTRALASRRFLVLLAASIVLASATNVAVAWTLGRLMWKRTPLPHSVGIDFGADSVNLGGYSCVGVTELFWQPRTAQNWYFNSERLDANKNPTPRPLEPALSRPWKTQILPNWVPSWTGFESMQSTPRRVEEVWASGQGWPLRSFHCLFVDGSLWGKPFRLTYSVVGGVPLDNKIDRHAGGGATFHYSGLAYSPIWSGLLVNTAFFALVWLGLLYFCGTGRRWWPAPGRCTSCGYNLQGLKQSVCPECGKSLHPSPDSH